VLTQRLDGANTEHARAQTNLEACIAHLNDCHAAYLHAPPTVRRQLNQAFFDKIYVDEDGTIRFGIAEPFALLLDPQVRSAAVTAASVTPPPTDLRKSPQTVNSTINCGGHRFSKGLNKTTMVELRGFEPLAPSMRTRCATGLRHSPQPGETLPAS
jgi:site-specific DNA recombinase